MSACNPGSSKRNNPCDNTPTNEISVSLADLQLNRLLQPMQSHSENLGFKLLPASYELIETADLVVLITSMVMELISVNDKIPILPNQLTRFHSRSSPQITVHDYLRRLTAHAHLSPPILLSMVFYIDLLCAAYPAFIISSLTIHRFLIVSATVASKGISDSFWTNKTYARIGGISSAELAVLELEFLFRVKWRIIPKPEVLGDYYRFLVERCDGFGVEIPCCDSG
ncbi:Nuc-1 negative regulatory protein preg [Penicillium samsonianum]|uniref:Nuc-1 negative regulatory protein preg n=1 Tax=Penicillium samsonianum TaxID=1882272 RepID=UPI002546C1BF|nr:Nuc-1 negative regulatory protein preg [Penicillium samsonianum]KAJ6118945.1 Nuc-1 negative regulatory protein preg [Penicillium samsonianum]